jgi:electron transfer flavoprotein alpha subunit
MKTIQVNQGNITDPKTMERLCPFGAIEAHDGTVTINETCRLCLICVKQGPKGAFELVEERTNTTAEMNLDEWKGILVYIEHHDQRIHPVSLEMLGKAHELARKSNYPVYCILIGDDLDTLAGQLLAYGPDKICIYQDQAYTDFRIEPYTAAMTDAIEHLKPAVVLVGGTVNGRTLAPRTAARLGTGLTADCTVLDIQTTGDLDQIRPAFGGNIMAHIRTPHHRPQFATVRYKIFDSAAPRENPACIVEPRRLHPSKLTSSITVLDTKTKGTGKFIEDADVIVAVGKGIGKAANLPLFAHLAEVLGGQLACTRPLVEEGWVDPRRQIGLSGRTVKPKLIITCGVSGSVQFVAGMKGAEKIIAINTDRDATIFHSAHIGIVGDIFTIVPELIASIENSEHMKTTHS